MEQKKEDIFDRMMHLHLFRIFEPFYQKNKEMLLYLLFGGLTTDRQHYFLDFCSDFRICHKQNLGIPVKNHRIFRCLPGNDKILRWSPVYTWCRRIASVSFYYLASWKQCTCKICSTDRDSGAELYY